HEPAQVLIAFGGVTGDRGMRDGDIGCEKVPVSQFFAPKASYSRDNTVKVRDGGFTVAAPRGTVDGACTGPAKYAIADANDWDDPAALVRSAGKPTDRPIVLATIPVQAETPVDLVLIHRSASAATQPATLLPTPALDRAIDQAIEQNRAVARQVVVDTPDPFVNSAASALCVAADALWDEKSGTYMHGGVAWRRPYLGWRGPYCGDASGQHDRTQSHLEAYFAKQSAKPPAATQPAADADARLARSERQLRTDGDLIDSHYDMNLVAIDAFFRHLLWTGDLAMAKRDWPIIERHFAWEKRLFRRPFGSQRLPLYEAYACIWASDDLQYSGGGVTHASAYNAYENEMAARVATLIGKDPTPYRQEAAAIRQAMRAYLWLAPQGQFAECRDGLGQQLIHPDAGLWTYSHSIDSQVTSPLETWQLARSIETQAVHIPLGGAGVPAGYSTLATSDWTPYDWSTNNVDMADVEHAALAEWQGGRAAEAFTVWKGAILDAMFMGQCPGNLHMLSQFDANRGESQRDFGDPTGISWRALVEGLFGIRPDALAGELLIEPGFPSRWDHASIRHPDVSFSFRRDNGVDHYEIAPHFSRPMRVRLRLRVPGEANAAVRVNGKPATWTSADAVGEPCIDIVAEPGDRTWVDVNWGMAAPALADDRPQFAAFGDPLHIRVPWSVSDVADPQGVLAQMKVDSHGVTGTVAGSVGPHALFLHARCGELTWWEPFLIDIHPRYAIVNAAIDLAGRVSFRFNNNMPRLLKSEDFTVRVDGQPMRIDPELMIDTLGRSEKITVQGPPVVTPGMHRLSVTVAGTNEVTQIPTETVTAEVVNWQIVAPRGGFDAVDLSGDFNDSVTQIFKNRYESPRSPFCSLARPTQGFGGWATNKTTPTIDDAGLRAAGGSITVAGVPLATPTAGRNVLFVSQWDNYPRQANIALSGRARGVYLMMAGSTNPMQSRMENGEVIVTYADGTTDRLVLRNPETWWPIEQDYLSDDYAFNIGPVRVARVDLKSGQLRLPIDGKLPSPAGMIRGGAATVLNVPLDETKPLKSLTVRAITNEVVIGLMSVTLERPTNAGATSAGSQGKPSEESLTKTP
ncbi:MAG: hypothetical protein ACTHM6_05350, partial [Tepidisphaeraceae bacterium]